jgi:hypothetical protein
LLFAYIVTQPLPDQSISLKPTTHDYAKDRRPHLSVDAGGIIVRDGAARW